MHLPSWVVVGVTAASFALVAPASAEAAHEVLVSGDAYVSAAFPHRNFDSRGSLRVGSRPLTRAYLRFRLDRTLPAGAHATLRLFVDRGDRSPVTLYTVRRGAWDERTITHATAPRLVRAIAHGTAEQGRWLSLDVSAAVRGAGTYTLAVAPSGAAIAPVNKGSTDSAIYFSGKKGRHKGRLVIDTRPPSVPAGLTARTLDANSVSLVWQQSTDDVGVAEYGVYRDAVLILRTTAAEATISGLACGTSYAFAVDARDSAGNGSQESPPVVGTTTACEPPAAAAPPVISGTEQEGKMLAVSDGAWTGSAPITFGYQWERCDPSEANCTPIGGAAQATYLVRADDIGQVLRVAVTATNTTGSARAVSAPTAVVGGQDAGDGGWTNVVDDRFDTDGAVPPHWVLYRYAYSSSKNCTAPEHVSVFGGSLRLRMTYESVKPSGSVCSYESGWYTGGMALRKEPPYAAVDQRVTVRWRVVPNGVVSHRIIPMRWPADLPNNAHGEEDWCEGHSNLGCYTFLHWLNSNGTIGTARGGPYTVDLTQWHTMRAEKSGYTLRFFVDDLTTPLWTYVGTEQELPSRPRVAVLQQECLPSSAGGCPSGTTGGEEIQIDWITVDNRS